MKMKKLMLYFLFVIVTTLASYLLGCFYAVSFNIAYWPDETRQVFCMMMPFLWFIGVPTIAMASSST